VLLGGLANRFDHDAQKVTSGVEKVFERGAMARQGAIVGEVGGHVGHGGLELVQPVVKAAKVGIGDDRLPLRHRERSCSLASLEGALPVGCRAELPRSSGARRWGDRAVTPGAPETLD
jgi:hypothetical protein